VPGFVEGHGFSRATERFNNRGFSPRDSQVQQGAEKRQQLKDQLEALILQMYKSNILYSEAVREFKERFIVTVLEENKGNQCKAARQLGMHRNTLSRTMQELKIDVRPMRSGAKRPPRSARPAIVERKQAR
jgi:DNA-binding NtrC family response regulator